jgi:hypothetical protein
MLVCAVRQCLLGAASGLGKETGAVIEAEPVCPTANLPTEIL